MSRIFLLALFIPLVAAAPLSPPIVIQLKPAETLLGIRDDAPLIPRRPYGHLAMVAEIGTPSKMYVLAVNSASKKSFVAKKGFDKGNIYTRYYDPTESETAESLKQTFYYKDGNITVKGEMYKDYIEVYPVATALPFGAISELEGLDTLYDDGQLGLSWDPQKDEKETPYALIHTMLRDRPKRVYQFYSKPSHGSIIIGDSGMYPCDQHETVWLPLIEAEVPTVMVNSFELGKYHYAADHRAVFDSSIESIHLPKDPLLTILKTYNAKFDKQHNAYLTSCSQLNLEWKITINGKEFPISEEYLLVDIHLNGRCALMVAESKFSGKDQMFRLGMPFFHHYCATFDVANNKLGFSESIDT